MTRAQPEDLDDVVLLSLIFRPELEMGKKYLCSIFRLLSRVVKFDLVTLGKFPSRFI